MNALAIFSALLALLLTPSTTVLWTHGNASEAPYTVVYEGDFSDPQEVEPGSTKRTANATGKVTVYDRDGNEVAEHTVQAGDEVVEDRPPEGGDIYQVTGIRPGGI